MIKAVWEPSGPPSAEDQLAELERMRRKCLLERHLDEEYYAARLKYIETAEAAIHARQTAIPLWETWRKRSAETLRELSETNPLHCRVVSEKLRLCGYQSWQVDKLIQYASFIQARGWDAFYPEDAAFLKQKYAEANVNPETIDFRI